MINYDGICYKHFNVQSVLVYLYWQPKESNICSVNFIYLIDQEKIFCIGKDLIWNVFFLFGGNFEYV